MKTWKKYKPDVCDNKMTFEECELAILRQSVDENEKLMKQKIANSEEVTKMIEILETFLVRKKLVCYGGTAINNILPKNAQFYNRDVDVPDYDFFSSNALSDAKELADIYFKEGYSDVEAKSGVHHGTFKVFVNFIPIADITSLEPQIFKSLKKEAISIAGILYAPPNYLRMGMYLELSRPAGDISRWEKVFKRLVLLNKYYPFKNERDVCATVDFQRGLEDEETATTHGEQIYFTARDSFIDQGVVFFGGYAALLYSMQLPEGQRKMMQKNPDFDVLALDINKCAAILKERLSDAGIKNVKSIHHPMKGEIIPERIEIRVGKDTIAFIYKPIACHNYNILKMFGKEINVATIDTMMSFYLAFIYADEYSFFKDRILCMAEFLFEVERHNRLEQKGALKRFSSDCIGTQQSLEDIRALKTEMFKRLSDKKSSKEYEEWFLKYTPGVKDDATKANVPKRKSKSNSSIVLRKPTKTAKRKLPFPIPFMQIL